MTNSYALLSMDSFLQLYAFVFDMVERNHLCQINNTFFTIGLLPLS